VLSHPSILGRPILPSAALLILLACGGGSGPSPGGPDGGGGGSTVNGQVLDGFGQGLSGRTVLIAGRTTTTDASGKFTLSGATIPYDLVIIEPAPAKVATVYAQLTRLDPKLYDFAGGTSASVQATLAGNIAGGDPFPTATTTLTGVSWGSAERSTGSYVTSTPYSFPVAWSGPSSSTGSVHALQWTVDANGTVTGYRAHGVKTGVTLTTGTTTSNADVLLTAVLTDNVSATITAPSGYNLVERTLYLVFDDQAYFPVSDDTVATPTLSLPVPSGIGAKVIISATGNNGSAQTTAQLSGVAPGTSGAALTLPAPALPTAPVDGATGVDTSTDLVWTPVAGALHLLVLGASAADPTYIIVSGGTRARIPDLGAQGLGLPSARQYEWGLVAIGPYTGIDDFAATGTLPREGVGFQTVTSILFTTR
jgi:hypothetical protein